MAQQGPEIFSNLIIGAPWAFKVAGTKDGITALQMDHKMPNVSTKIMREALEQARQARLFILGKMTALLAEPRPDLSPNAPPSTPCKFRWTRSAS